MVDIRLGVKVRRKASRGLSGMSVVAPTCAVNGVGGGAEPGGDHVIPSRGWRGGGGGEVH